MLHLVSSIYASLFKEVEFNVLIVGQEASGKSTLLEQIKFMYSASNPPTTDAPVAVDKPSAGSDSEGLASLKRDLHKSLTPTHADHVTRSNATTSTVPSGPGAAIKKSTSNVVASSAPSSSSPAVALPPGTPVPATSEYLDKRRIRPTVGMNYAKITHYFAPLAAVMEMAPAPAASPAAGGAGPSDALPPPPQRQPDVALHAAPSSAHTQLTFWDLGGQSSLRPLWRSYFAQCHGVVLVVDASVDTARAGGDAVRATDRQILVQLLNDPLLKDVPILIFCNKCDQADHASLAKMQDELDLIGIATQMPFYPLETADDAATDGSDKAAPHGERRTAETAFSGAGGFGNRLFRLVDGSARTGSGVAAGLDWLVSQLLREARTLSIEDDK